MQPPRTASRALSFAVLLLVIGPLVVTLAPPAAAADPVPSLAGVWQTEEGHFFQIVQDPGETDIDSVMGEDPCTGGPRSYIIKGSLDGAQFTGTMQRCDELDHELVVNCNLAPVWEAPYWANVSNYEIVGEYEGEFYRYETDNNGTITGCTLEDKPMNSVTLTRIDCWIKTFEELGAERISDPTLLDTELDLAQRAEGGERLLWTAAQQAPGGLKEQAEAFKAELPSWGYTATINSAYRPVLYQAHFADLRTCGIQIANAAMSFPDAVPLLSATVDAINAEVANHALKFGWINVSSLHIKVPFVCYREPIETCPHTDQRAVDMSISPDDSTLDFLGAVHGLCRPYVNTVPPDRPHWDRVGDNPFTVDKCHQLGVGPGEATITIEGNSPINILLTDPNGYRVGFDPGAGSVVNEFGADGAFYSGPGSEPQVIQIFAGNGVAGDYSVTGAGTGNGSYTLTGSVVNSYGDTDGQAQVAGTATFGDPIVGLDLTLEDNYSPDPVILAGVVTSTTGGATQYGVPKNGTTHTVTTSGGGLTSVVYSDEINALAMATDGTGGPATVTVPQALASGTFSVRAADGTVIPVTQAHNAAQGTTTLTFEVPAGTKFVVASGQAGIDGPAAPPPSTPAGGMPIVIAAAAVAVVALRRRRTP